MKQSADARKYKLTVRQREVLEVLAGHKRARIEHHKILYNGVECSKCGRRVICKVSSWTIFALWKRKLIRTVTDTDLWIEVISQAGRQALDEQS